MDMSSSVDDGSRGQREEKRIVLVTGCPRSGTTAVGDYLAAGPGSAYLYEPFNYHSGVRTIRRYFEVPGAGDFTNADLDRLVGGVRAMKLKMKVGLFPEDKGIKRILKILVGGRSRVSYWRCRIDPWLHTIIWKDPLAAFAAAAIAERHDIPVLVTVREPLAVAASFKRMNWAFQVEEISGRLREAGIPIAEFPEILDGHLRVPAINGALIWAMIYTALMRCSVHLPFYFVDIQDIVNSPVDTYRILYSRLDLEWTSRVEQRIRRGYQSGVATDKPLPRRAHVRNRDISAVNTYGREMLTADEAAIVHSCTEETWAALQALPSRIVP